MRPVDLNDDTPTHANRRVVVYRTSSIGDVILASACLDLLDRLHLADHARWVGRSPSIELLAASWTGVAFTPAARSGGALTLFRAARDLRETRLFVDLQCNLRSRALGMILRWRYGAIVVRSPKAQTRRTALIAMARWRGRSAPLPQTSLSSPHLQYETMRDTLANGLRRAGYTVDPTAVSASRPRLTNPATTSSAVTLPDGEWIAVAPGAAHPTKQAPIEIMASVFSNLASRWRDQPSDKGSQPPGLVVLGGPGDVAVGADLLNQIRWPGPVATLAGRLSLHETGIVLSRCLALVSNDSALGHLAESFDTPVGVLFGPTVEGFGFPPRLPTSRAFSSRLGCRPCSKHGKTPCRYGDSRCFHEIDTAAITSWLADRALHGRTTP